MREERPHEGWFTAAGAALALVTAPGLGALAGGAGGALAGGAVGVAAAWGLFQARRSRRGRRRALLARPFPDPWRRVLEERYDHYHRLSAELKGRFESDLRIFAAEKRVTGIGVAVSEELRVLVAASAVTLSLGWPDYEWDQLTEVLLYPQDFGRDYSFEESDLSGQAHPWGTVILSVPALEESFADPDDGYHVGIHEFAHLIDLDQARFAGIPAGLSRAEEWVSLVERETDRLRRGKSVLDPYAAEGPPEFLAVAVETFFEAPLALRKRHREVYQLLAEYFRQDPAAWDDARGLVL